jgi:hypothetical protein
MNRALAASFDDIEDVTRRRDFQLPTSSVEDVAAIT